MEIKYWLQLEFENVCVRTVDGRRIDVKNAEKFLKLFVKDGIHLFLSQACDTPEAREWFRAHGLPIEDYTEGRILTINTKIRSTNLPMNNIPYVSWDRLYTKYEWGDIYWDGVYEAAEKKARCVSGRFLTT